MYSESTKDKIIDAAKIVFIRKGMDGARMQEIADEAGINKALLHYYFHSKQELFNAVLYGVLRQMIQGLIVLFKKDEPFEDKLVSVVSQYDTFMNQNPYLPQFIVREINRDPDQLSDFMTDQGLDLNSIRMILENVETEGGLSPAAFPHLFISMIGLVVMPYLGRPLFQRKLFDNSPERYERFLAERKDFVAQLLRNAIRTKR
ncbi:MAG: TetR/AcrR family transcriptional regulator [Marinilabiliales bacterium]|nr:TetR/AcrR family transcriptional regulator [Marinilabiliales bacterium]